MTSKCRNMLYENKKQETTEICLVSSVECEGMLRLRCMFRLETYQRALTYGGLLTENSGFDKCFLFLVKCPFDFRYTQHSEDDELVAEKMSTRKVCAKLVLKDDQKILWVKTKLSVFFDAKGVVHKELLQGQTVNAAYYEDVLERLRKRALRVRKDIAPTWVLRHDNAPSHATLRVSEPQLPQPPHNLDSFLFPKFKTSLKGTRFGTIEAIQRAANEVPVEAFLDAYCVVKSVESVSSSRTIF
ncbi:hypothetical protein AAG570_003231 [Ranatra chinensis]|uniref:Transposase n=1 Tax=Ranatra chinensis TaxID=642074 RepID=A0ABD0Y676_9HEMI